MTWTARRRSRGVGLAAAALGLVLIVGCRDDAPDTAGSGPATATSTSTPTDPAATDPAATTAVPAASAADPSAALDLAVADLLAMPGGPPAVVVVTQIDDERTVRAGGVRDIGTDIVPTADDHMRLASVTKAFGAAAALALVDQDVLSLDDTIGDWLPDLPTAWEDVRLRQLLDHTSGVPDFIRSPSFATAVSASLDVAPPPAELLSYVADQPLAFPAGSQYAYSNSDNITVGLMIEAATGRPFAEVLAEQVLDPLGLADTSLPTGVELPDPSIHGYALSDDGEFDDVTEGLAGGWAWAAGGIVSTPNDLNTFIRGYVSGELYGADVRAEQQTLFNPGGASGPPGPGENSASLALFRYQTPCGTVYGHTGNTVGFTQFAVASPDGSRSAIVAINLQRTDSSEGQDAHVFDALQRVEQAAICFILADH